MANDNLDSAQVFEPMLDNLYSLNFNQRTQIETLEQSVYAALQQYPNDNCGLIALMFVHIMFGRREEAQSLAYRIWERGGKLPAEFELAYIENLLSLGLVDMAAVLLKPRFENLRENIDDFYSVLSKFSVMTGNLALLERLEAFPDIAGDDSLLYEFADIYRELGCQTQFKEVQKLILENAGEAMCAYEYNLYDDRDLPDLEIELYCSEDEIACLNRETVIENKIEAYWRSTGKDRLYNLSVRVLNIRQHESWFAEEE